MVYNGLTPATNATLSGSVSGAVAGDTITLNTSGLALDYNTAHVLTANAINASGSAGFTIGTTTVSSLASDYSFTGPTISSVSGTITPAPLSVTANNASKTYGTTQTYLGNEFTQVGLVNGETISSVTLSSTGDVSTASVARGPYAITAIAAIGGTFSASDYTISYVNGALTVNPATLTVTANADSKIYDGLAYSGGNGVVYSGLVNNETSTVLGGALVYGGSSQGAINAGNYLITPSGLTTGNYTISYVDGALTVSIFAPPTTAPPTVISQIAVTSSLLTTDCAQNTSSCDQEKKPKPEDVVVAGNQPADGTTAPPLLVCPM